MLSVPSSSVYVNPKLVTDPQGTVTVLGSMLGLSSDRQQKLLGSLEAKEKSFVYVSRQIDDDVAAAVMALNLPGVDVLREDKRTMPSGEVGRSVLGRTETFGGKDTDFSAQLTKIKSLNPDAIVVSALVEAGAFAAVGLTLAMRVGIALAGAIAGGAVFTADASSAEALTPTARRHSETRRRAEIRSIGPRL